MYLHAQGQREHLKWGEEMNDLYFQRAGQSAQLLFVDDEEQFLEYTRRKLNALGYGVVTSSTWDEAKNLLKDPDVRPQIIFVEPCLKDGGFNHCLQEICAEAQQIPVVVLSSSRDPQNIMGAIRDGACEYVYKPFDIKQLNHLIFTILNSEVDSGTTATKTTLEEPKLIFSSPQMKRIYDTVQQISDTTVPVLIHGESGVGKDLIARMVHQKSGLLNKLFVKVNCAAMPGELVESELFGYRKGAFTGAHIDRPGKFEFAHGGTIFLDEIGEFSPSIQAKLLQVLQDGTFTRLGSNRETDVKVRVIAATNRKLEEAIESGRFRADLYYRLNVVSLEIPPLRQRREEIPLFCNYFLEKFGSQYNSSVSSLPKKLEKLFYAYHWPGNVRELENLIKRYIVLQDAKSIQLELESKMTRQTFDEINEITEKYLQENEDSLDLKEISRKAAAVAEKNMIEKSLSKTKWNKWKAAKELKVSYKTLLTKIEKYKIRPSS